MAKMNYLYPCKGKGSKGPYLGRTIKGDVIAPTAVLARKYFTMTWSHAGLKNVKVGKRRPIGGR